MCSRHTTPNGSTATGLDISNITAGGTQLPCDHGCLQTIAALQDENKKLKVEVKEFRLRHDEIEKQFSAQSEHMFRKAAEMQAEIDNLKAGMRTQQRARHGRSPKSSPSSLSPDITLSSPGGKVAIDETAARSRPTFQSLMSRQRFSLGIGCDPEKPEEQSLNHRWLDHAASNTSKGSMISNAHSRAFRTKKRKSYDDDGKAAISVLAEDGEGPDDPVRSNTTQKRGSNQANATLIRLEKLMSTPASASAHIPFKVIARSPISMPEASRIKETNDEQQISAVSSLSINQPGNSGSLQSNFARARPGSRSHEVQASRQRSHLSLQAPATGLRVGKESRDAKCEGHGGRQTIMGGAQSHTAGLFDTFKTNPSSMSDDDLLVQFLGPGSEKRVHQLTRPARINLLHEAKTKLIAGEFSTLRRPQSKRRHSPTGFWQTDMSES